MSEKNQIFSWDLAKIYPMYVNKAEKKGRAKAEVDEIIEWMLGYDKESLQNALDSFTLEEFIVKAPKVNPKRELITGVVCGVRVEEVEDPLMRETRRLDKLVDELAKGKSMEKILRT